MHKVAIKNGIILIMLMSAILFSSQAVTYHLPYFAPLNSGRMDRNASSSGSVCSWGKLFLYEGKAIKQFKDAKVWAGKQNALAKEWDWSLTGTRHTPGVQPADLYEFIDQVDEVILTRGVESVLQVPQATIDYVRSKGKVCHVGETPDMIELFNKLVDQDKKVGGLFHSTC
jgi:hypothetical protein